MFIYCFQFSNFSFRVPDVQIKCFSFYLSLSDFNLCFMVNLVLWFVINLEFSYLIPKVVLIFKENYRFYLDKSN